MLLKERLPPPKLAAARPYRDWLRKTQIQLTDLPAEIGQMPPDPKTLLYRQQAFGYTQCK